MLKVMVFFLCLCFLFPSFTYITLKTSTRAWGVPWNLYKANEKRYVHIMSGLTNVIFSPLFPFLLKFIL